MATERTPEQARLEAIAWAGSPDAKFTLASDQHSHVQVLVKALAETEARIREAMERCRAWMNDPDAGSDKATDLICSLAEEFDAVLAKGRPAR
jgi:hypothetical protein